MGGFVGGLLVGVPVGGLGGMSSSSASSSISVSSGSSGLISYVASALLEYSDSITAPLVGGSDGAVVGTLVDAVGATVACVGALVAGVAASVGDVVGADVGVDVDGEVVAAMTGMLVSMVRILRLSDPVLFVTVGEVVATDVGLGVLGKLGEGVGTKVRVSLGTELGISLGLEVGNLKTVSWSRLSLSCFPSSACLFAELPPLSQRCPSVGATLATTPNRAKVAIRLFSPLMLKKIDVQLSALKSSFAVWLSG